MSFSSLRKKRSNFRSESGDAPLLGIIRRIEDLLPHVSRRCGASTRVWNWRIICTRWYLWGESIVSPHSRRGGRAEEGRERASERREWSRSAFSCSLTNRSPVLRTSLIGRTCLHREEKTTEKERRVTTRTRTRTTTLLRTVSSPTPPIFPRRSYPPHRDPAPSLPRLSSEKLGEWLRDVEQVCSLTSTIARNLQWPRAKYQSTIFIELSLYTGR